ncbi:hypothetical protein D3C72_697230 [compost metagenome]
MARRVCRSPGRRHAGAAHRRVARDLVRGRAHRGARHGGCAASPARVFVAGAAARGIASKNPGRIRRPVRRARRQDRPACRTLHQPRQARRGRRPRRHHERRGFLHRLRHRHAEYPGGQPERGRRPGAGCRPVPALRPRPALQHRGLRQPRHAQGCHAVAQPLPLREVQRIQAQAGGGAAHLSGRGALVSGHRRAQFGNAGVRAGGVSVSRQGVVQPHEQPGLRHRGLQIPAGRQDEGPAHPAAIGVDQPLHQRDQRAGRLHRAGHRHLRKLGRVGAVGRRGRQGVHGALARRPPARGAHGHG